MSAPPRSSGAAETSAKYFTVARYFIIGHGSALSTLADEMSAAIPRHAMGFTAIPSPRLTIAGHDLG